jgi:hypothetical protein
MPLRSHPLAKPDCQLILKGGIARRKVARTVVALPAIALTRAHASSKTPTLFKNLNLHSGMDQSTRAAEAS